MRHLYREWELIRDDAGDANPTIRHHPRRDRAARRPAAAEPLEGEFLHSQKLEALGTLAGGVAHELNKTLVPILALSRLALDDLPQDHPMRGDMEAISQASGRARDLVEQILSFARKQDLVKQPVDLAMVVREALRMMRASLPATVQIIEQISGVPPVFGDSVRLHQVVVNLVTNAAQAIGGVIGTITVRIWVAGESQASPSKEWLNRLSTCRLRIQEPASRQRRSTASSSRSLRPRMSARAPAWGCRSCRHYRQPWQRNHSP